MAHLDHLTADSPPEDEAEIKRNSQLGLGFFAFYGLFYAAFVLLNAFTPDLMQRAIIPGINLAVAYGFALILAAFLVALLYAWLARANRPVKNRPSRPEGRP